ncbi:helix-turn-helix transcriptional regulator [Marinobacterium rhizophilum]|uniref:Helix-turn-helix domain-containing protein n=1 Tax=Marinobacterium rhizophilum TaxID=420402 RepID=A0ABY5HP41_9GAMM|nr:AraC family transcriptional regulator [Marinobacterium rhizophilum]UTW13552.1 helix-turn-helix domain-containing protein [Marinobacterium rhizophilum]
MNNSQARRNLIARQSGEHSHDYAQVLIGWRGRMDCRFADTAGRLASGTAALVPASAGHLYEGLSDSSELLVIDVSLADPYIASLEAACDLQFSETLFQRPDIIPLNASTLPLLDFAASQLERGPDQSNALVSCQLVSLFMTQLCQLYLSDSVPVPARTRLDVAQLNRYIDSQLAQAPSNAALASSMNLSESHFHYLFQRQFGTTPQQYLMHRRLQHARYLLLNSRMPLATLALEVGFADASSFSRAYKKRFNETPGQARRALQDTN